MTDIDYSVEPESLERPDMDAIEATLPTTNGHVTASTDPDWTIANGAPELPERETDEPQTDDDIEFAPGMPKVRSRSVDGATFVLSVPDIIPSIWGDEDGIAWAQGEGLMLVGPDGVGKTSLVQQLVLRRAGILTGPLLGMDVKPAEGRILYIAADRPRQAASSFRRMVTDADHPKLRERLEVWQGPLEFEINEAPTLLREFIDTFDDISDVVIDSLKDVADDLSDNKIGSRVSRAMQEVIASGYELIPLHHQVKQQRGQPAPKKLSDVYGSRWLTAGMGSVLLLWGDPGDPVVELRHLKQPEGEIGPFNVVHDHDRGTSNVHERIDLVIALQLARNGLTVTDAAICLFEKTDPSKSEIEKARRRLNKLAESGRATKIEKPGEPVRYYDLQMVRDPT